MRQRYDDIKAIFRLLRSVNKSKFRDSLFPNGIEAAAAQLTNRFQ